MSHVQKLLAMRGICKSFPGVRALHQVDLHLGRGEVLALLGENGAGKSTLIKTLGGAHQPDSGRISIEGKEIEIRSPVASQKAGIAVIYQEFNLIPALTASENIFLGRERTAGGLIQRNRERDEARKLFERIGVAVDVDAPCRELSIAGQQVVEIAKALSLDAKILVMDEPSATLTPAEVNGLFQVVNELRQQGLGIIYISHRLEEVFQIADRVTVLRDGELVGSTAIDEINRDQLIEWMVGRKLENEFPHREPAIGRERFKVCNVSHGPSVSDVSLQVHAGEVVAITGLVGAGRTELARLLFGADKCEHGTIELDGKKLNIKNPRDAIAAGIGLLCEDRKSHGLVLNHGARENFGLPNLGAFSKYGFVNRRKESHAFQAKVKGLQVKIADENQPVKNLSGGNQQKIVLAKWLEKNCDVILFDEPTRGIDVGAKFEIYQLINQLAAQGKAIIMISSELPEVIGMADRILVMRSGRISGELQNRPPATQTQIMELAV